MKRRVLSVLLMLCMVCSLLPTVAFAEEVTGEANVSNATQLYEAAVSDEVTKITLADNISDFTTDKYVSFSGSKTLDLAGYTIDLDLVTNITYKDKMIVEADAALIIKDSSEGAAGKITYDLGGTAPRTVTALGTLTLKSGTIEIGCTGNAVYAASGSNVVMDGGKIVSTVSTTGAVNLNGGAKFLLNGGQIESIRGAVSIKPNTDKPEDPTIFEMTSGTIESGSISGNMGLGSTVSISGGEIKVPFSQIQNGTLNISGGTFSEKVTLASPLYASITGGNFTVPMEASITRDGTEYFYPTVANAISAVADGETVRLLKDITLSNNIYITKTAILDLDGKTIDTNGKTIFANIGADLQVTGNGKLINAVQATPDESGKYSVPLSIFHVAAGANLTIINGTFESASHELLYTEGSVTIKDGSFKNTENSKYNSKSTMKVWGENASLNMEAGTVNMVAATDPESGMYGLAAFNGATITLGTDKSGPTINSFYAAVAGNNLNAECNITINSGTFTSCAIDGTKFSSAIYLSATGDVTIHGGTFDGGRYAVSLPYPEAGVNLAITDGYFKDALYIGNENSSVKPGPNVIKISGGYFKDVPDSAHMETGYIAVESDKSAYNYMVIEAENIVAEVVAGAPEVAKPENLNGNNVADNAEVALKETKSPPTIKGGSIDAEANTIAKDTVLDVTKKDEYNTLKQLDGNTDLKPEDVKIVVQPYMNIAITGASANDADEKYLTLDIESLYRTVITTQEAIDDGLNLKEDKNAVEIDGMGGKLEPKAPVTVTIPLPAGFVTDNATEVFVTHIKNGKSYIYTATVTEVDGSYTATFTNPHGFSEFKVELTNPSKVESDGIGYKTLEEAIDAAEDGAIIKLKEAITETVSISKNITFTLEGDVSNVTIQANGGYELKQVGNVYTVVRIVSPGDGGGGGSTTTYHITIADVKNGTVSANKDTAAKNTTITLTISPNEGYELDKLMITDKNGDEITLSKKSNSKYTFTMPASKVTVNATFAEKSDESDRHFTDVAKGTWYYDAVYYAYENGMMSGISSSLFDPDGNTTRGMIVTILYRLEGEPAVGTSAFPDVANGQFYTNAVAWAAKHDIVAGYPNGNFGPTDTITREQMAAIMYRYAAYKGYDVTGSANLSSFIDDESISDYALVAMEWANNAGLIQGKDGNALDPQGLASRSQVAAIMMRFCEDVVK